MMNAHSDTATARPYVMVLGALLLLTAVTVAAASVDFESASVNVVIALTIATFKASLVALYFMHLRHDKLLNSIIFLSGLAFLALFLIFCLIDAGSRKHVQPSDLKAPPAATATQ
ncbi:MAG: cytochrome C oxidase subunit IV family protein [Bryobacterales bacterium]|nr:cytochrome C oxidase subunit IV family protein [Bryobacterales bacterium]MEB2361964.1 cytochrome C oxidase subunit IV family protein [Bryobacterales bacterium]